jgi:uncharacterized protein (DUF58 family)
MGIGGSIFLIALGAIIAFGVKTQSLGPFDLDVVGWVLMLAGLVGLALTMYVWNSRRRRVVTTQGAPVERHIVQQPPAAGTIVEEEIWTEGPPERRV